MHLLGERRPTLETTASHLLGTAGGLEGKILVSVPL